MGLMLDRGWWYYVKRVPKRFAHVDPRPKITRALFTDSETEARRKAVAVETEIFAYWEALAAGRANDAAAAYDAAKRLAAARGFAYRPQVDLAGGPVDEILARLEALVRRDGTFAPLTEAAAILGAVEKPPVKLTEALDDFCRFAALDRLAGKSDRQVKAWRLPRDRAVANFVKVNGDLAILEIRRTEAQKLRDWWAKRIEVEGVTRESANKDFGHLSDLFRAWSEYHQIAAENPFAKLRFKKQGGGKTVGVPFSDAFIRDNLLKAGALDGLNVEARDILLVMVNTGARPSEIMGCAPGAFQTVAPVPHLDIGRQIERVLKTESSPRQIPLLGVSLEAAKRIAARGGIARYADKANSWSAAVNKFLVENGLRETVEGRDTTAYSLRHSFEDRMTEAGVDDRIRAELMGHKYERPDYGRGGSLEVRAKALALIAL